MTEQGNREKSGGRKGILSVLGLVLLLGLLVYGAPRLNQYIRAQKEESEQAKEQAGVVENEVAVPQMHVEWIPIIEKQLPADKESSYQVMQVRLSDDRKKLLIDLQITTGDDKSRSDLILERDEFGRYVSDNDVVPMKLYLPEVNVSAGPAESIAPDQK